MDNRNYQYTTPELEIIYLESQNDMPSRGCWNGPADGQIC